MKIQEAIKILKIHNKWRRGAEIPQESPTTIGVAIDTVVNEFKSRESMYNTLKKNARYESVNCKGFVYLSQIEEILNDEIL